MNTQYRASEGSRGRTGVRAHVLLQVPGGFEGFVAHVLGALVGFLSRVGAQVTLEAVPRGERFTAGRHLAPVGTVARVGALVHLRDTNTPSSKHRLRPALHCGTALYLQMVRCGVEAAAPRVSTAEALLSDLLDFTGAPDLPLEHQLRETDKYISDVLKSLGPSSVYRTCMPVCSAPLAFSTFSSTSTSDPVS